MTTIAITGVGGLVGRRVVAALDERPTIDRIVGLDMRAPARLTSTKLVFRASDVRDPSIVDAFRGVDIVLHLASRMDPIHDEDLMRSVNVDGTRNVFESAAAAGVGRVIHLSSVVAYGAHPDNDFPLTEASPLRGTPGLAYAEQKRDIELWLWPWLEEHPELQATVLRPALVLGPQVENVVTRIFEAPRITAVKGHKPPLQFLHVDDLVRAIVHAVEHELTGAYNVAAEGWLSFDEVSAIVGRRIIEVPEEVAFSTADRFWKLGLGEQPPGVVSLFMHPWVMSSDAFLDTGWRPLCTNRDALSETVAEHAGYLAFAGVRADRRTLHRVGMVLGAVVGSAGFLALRRRRRSTADGTQGD